MSASTPTVHGGIGSRQLGAALAGVGLALAVVAGLAFGQLTAKPQAAPAAPAPAVAPGFDHGWSTDSSNVQIAPRVAPNFDHGWSTDSSNVQIAPRVAPGFDHGWSTDDSNVRIAPVVVPGFDHGWSTDDSNVTIPEGKGGSGPRRISF